VGVDPLYLKYTTPTSNRRLIATENLLRGDPDTAIPGPTMAYTSLNVKKLLVIAMLDFTLAVGL